MEVVKLLTRLLMTFSTQQMESIRLPDREVLQLRKYDVVRNTTL